MTRKELYSVAMMLVGLAAILHLAHYLVFHDLHHTIIYMVGDVAFLPIDILVLALIVERTLKRRELAAKSHKMNMVIGAFFSETGLPLLGLLDRFLPDDSPVYAHLAFDQTWSEADLIKAHKSVHQLKLDVWVDADGLKAVRQMLSTDKAFMLGLLQNPTLLEHESFTECLWSVFHLLEELSARPSMMAPLPDSDIKHLSRDVQRAYVALLGEWVRYMAHLKSDYPYLYSFAARTNPFGPHRDAIVTEG